MSNANAQDVTFYTIAAGGLEIVGSGGAQYKTSLGSLGLNLGAQLFNNVVRPTKGTVWDLRFLVELVF